MLERIVRRRALPSVAPNPRGSGSIEKRIVLALSSWPLLIASRLNAVSWSTKPSLWGVLMLAAKVDTYTRLRPRGRQPLWATGVMSLISLILSPRLLIVRIAASLPEPGPRE